jgi:hypothetical protein
MLFMKCDREYYIRHKQKKRKKEQKKREKFWQTADDNDGLAKIIWRGVKLSRRGVKLLTVMFVVSYSKHH